MDSQISFENVKQLVEKFGVEAVDEEDLGYHVALSSLLTKEIYKEFGEEGIDLLYKELYNRQVLRPDVIWLLHTWSLSYVALAKRPHYFPNKDQKYVEISY